MSPIGSDPATPGVPVTLADGRTWHFAVPSLRYRPRFAPADSNNPLGSARVEAVMAHPRPVRDRVRKLREACRTGSRADQVGSIRALGVALLVESHGIDPERARRLIQVAPPDFPRLAEAILAAVSPENPLGS